MTDRCGAGVAMSNGEGPAVTACEACVHWLQPNDTPLKPAFRQGRSTEWWARSGYCTRYAPSPSPDEERPRTHWRVTHAHDGCGDGELVTLAAIEISAQQETEHAAGTE